MCKIRGGGNYASKYGILCLILLFYNALHISTFYQFLSLATIYRDDSSIHHYSAFLLFQWRDTVHRALASSVARLQMSLSLSSHLKSILMYSHLSCGRLTGLLPWNFPFGTYVFGILRVEVSNRTAWPHSSPYNYKQTKKCSLYTHWKHVSRVEV